MKRTATSPLAIPRALLVPALAAALLLFSCGDSSEEPPPPDNQAPSVTLTGGPPQGEEASYLAEISWSGSDPDGTIDRFEYAVDPPAAFLSSEIADPEGSGLRRTSAPAAEDGMEILTYTKSVDGSPVSFRYVQTRAPGKTFLFSTPHPDSLESEPLARFSGMHTIYVRSRDDDGAVSHPAHLAYTAVTVTPSSHLIKPIVNGDILYLGTEAEFCWDGVDSDAPDTEGKPVAYLYKLINLAALQPPPGPFVDVEFLLFRHPQVASLPWLRKEADDRCFDSPLQAPGQYLFAVRAVDVAGAVEPFVEVDRGGEPGNAVVFQTRAEGVFPLLNVNEPSLGDVDGDAVGVRGRESTRFEVFTGLPLRFTWSASAESYGGRIEAFRYRIGETDSDWTSATGNPQPLLPPAGLETLTIDVRDTDGNTTSLEVQLEVIEAAFDREILLVDDSRNTTYPRDSERDRFWRDLAVNSGRLRAGDLVPEVLTFSTFGQDDVEHLNPIEPTLAQLGRYRRLIWDVHGVGYDGITALLKATGLSRHLGLYLRAGGQLWLSGEFSIAAMSPDTDGRGTFHLITEMHPDTFPWDILHLYSDDVRNSGTQDLDRDGLVGATPWPGTDFGFPVLELDTAKQRSALAGRYGVVGSNVLQDGPFPEWDPHFRGRIDPLYAFDAIDGGNSAFEGRLAAIRYTDLDPEPRQGRVAWFGFPLYFMHDDQAQGAFNAILDWFREETPAP